MRRSRRYVRLTLMVLAGLCWPPGASLADLASSSASADASEDLFALSLEELVEVQVSSVAGKASDWFTTPAAITVITGDRLRRSGHRNLIEALRMVPGVHVGRVDTRQWALGIRGFSNLFSNGIQVVIDGRAVYIESFGGVRWDVQELLLDNIDHIEIIRGPGATLWGANAVNGVINVISKSTADTKGTFVEGGGGIEERGFAGLRQGGELGAAGSYRVWGRYFERDSSTRERDGSARADDSSFGVGGFQLEHEGPAGSGIMVQGEVYSTDHFGESLPDGTGGSIDGEIQDDGGHILLQIDRHPGRTEPGDWTLRAFYDGFRRIRASGAVNRQLTYDVDFRQHLAPLPGHAVLWGSGYRFRENELTSDAFVVFPDETRSTHLVTGFVQDTITLLEDRLFLMAGTKLGNNDYSGFEAQPSVRLWWTPTPEVVLWTAISRPVRTPTFIAEEILFLSPVGPPLVGDRSLDAEKLIAYEAGIRTRLGMRANLDVSVFFNDHSDLIVQVPNPNAPGLIFANEGSAHGYGVEVAAMWRLTDFLRFESSYTFFRIETRNEGLSNREKVTPEHQFQIHGALDLPWNLELDAALYYVGATQVSIADPSSGISDYVRFDLGVTYRPSSWVEISLVGQNLTRDAHPEYFQVGRVDAQPEIERAFYARLALRF